MAKVKLIELYPGTALVHVKSILVNGKLTKDTYYRKDGSKIRCYEYDDHGYKYTFYGPERTISLRYNLQGELHGISSLLDRDDKEIYLDIPYTNGNIGYDNNSSITNYRDLKGDIKCFARINQKGEITMYKEYEDGILIIDVQCTNGIPKVPDDKKSDPDYLNFFLTIEDDIVVKKKMYKEGTCVITGTIESNNVPFNGGCITGKWTVKPNNVPFTGGLVTGQCTIGSTIISSISLYDEINNIIKKRVSHLIPNGRYVISDGQRRIKIVYNDGELTDIEFV